MQDHFSDDKFIEAAKVYKSIQAPSELREKILMGAEEKNAVEVMPRRKRVTLRQVSKALSMAACLAIMVAAMPDWIGDSGSELGVNEIAIYEESDASQGEEVETTDFAEKDDYEENDANAAIDSVQKPVSKSQVSSQVPSQVSEDVKSSKEEDVSQNERSVASVYSLERTSESEEENTISLDSVLPSGVAKDSPLRQMKVRVIETTDEECRMEITTAEDECTEISVSKNAENGHWEIHSAAEE